ncbi:hypothetical protein LQ953_13255 [Sphingomonas sp. IC-56]|nr:hypothetical protein [Sphingomonas sp. IC-56]MCD2324985.1 hypothetical protein [Sphingomonas sp. IC-56]
MTKPKAKKDAKAGKPVPGPRTSAAIRQAQEKHSELPLRPFLALGQGDDGKPEMGPTHSDQAGHSAWLHSSLGTTSTSFMLQQMHSLEVATAGAATGSEPNVFGLNAALAMLGAINPQDELEGALATQMVGCHSLSMAMLCRAKSTDRTDHLQLYGNLAVKLQRTFTAQVEALARLRGKGQQTVRVEHVTVHPGAQAIVGDVHHHAPGTLGAEAKNEVLPHATSETAAGAQGRAALPSPDSEGFGVPISSHAERPLPAPRRTVARRARQSKRAEARPLQPGGD